MYFIGRVLVRQWAAFRAQPLEADVRWLAVAASGALVLVTYALLVQTWRVLLAGSDQSLSFPRAVRIWTVSNLFRYVPGKVWQIGAMATLAERAQVSAVSAAGSAILSTVLNIAAGLAIVLILGWRWLDQIDPNARAMAIALIVVALVGLLLLPFAIPRLGVLISRLTGRQVDVATPRPRAIAIATAGNILSWLLYGVAFKWLVIGVLGDAPGAAWQYVAVFTASYVVGYLFLILPGGIGPREAVMVMLLTSLALATPKQAWLVAGASRVWLTVLEIGPGLLFVAHDVARRRSSTKLPKPPTDAPTN